MTALSEQKLRVFDPDLIEIPSGGHAGVFAEATCQIFLTHLKPLRQLRDSVKKGVVPPDDAERGLAHDKFGPIEDGKRSGQVEEDDSVVVEEPEPEPEPVP